MPDKNTNSRCKALNKRGEPCQAAATGGGLCYLHANPNKASELGRIGGRKNRHLASIETTDALPKLENATDLRDLVARLILEVYAGKLHPRIVSGLAPLMNLQLRAIEATDLEGRVAKVEKVLDMGGGMAMSNFDKSVTPPEETPTNGRVEKDIEPGEPE